MYPLMVSEVCLGSNTKSLTVICDSESEVCAPSFFFINFPGYANMSG